MVVLFVGNEREHAGPAGSPLPRLKSVSGSLQCVFAAAPGRRYSAAMCEEGFPLKNEEQQYGHGQQERGHPVTIVTQRDAGAGNVRGDASEKRDHQGGRWGSKEKVGQEKKSRCDVTKDKEQCERQNPTRGRNSFMGVFRQPSPRLVPSVVHSTRCDRRRVEEIGS